MPEFLKVLLWLRRSVAPSAAVALIPLLVSLSVAQTAPPVTSAPVKLGEVTFSGSLRARLYDWDWFQPASGNNSYAYSGNLLRLAISQKWDRWDWNAEFGVPFLLGL